MAVEISINASMIKMLKSTTRADILKEIRAFAGDYSHQIDGFDVVRVDQLLMFLESPGVNDGN